MKDRIFKVAQLTVTVRVAKSERDRIASRSFRGHDVARAGNFMEWNDVGEFLDSEEFRYDILHTVVDAALANENTFAIDEVLEDVVGWTTVTDEDDLWGEEVETEEGELTNGVTANFVVNLPAPATKLVTVIGRGRMTGANALTIDLYNVRPGMVTPPFPRPHRWQGKLVGARVPEELGLVFWSFDAPGDEDWGQDAWDEDEDFDPNYYFSDILGTMIINGKPYEGPFPDDFDHSP